MPVVHLPTPVEVLEALARVEAGQWIATDCDGTLWRGDIGDDVVRAAARSPGVFGLTSCDFEAYEARLAEDYEGACLYACDVLRGAAPAEAKRAIASVIGPEFAVRQWLLDGLNAAAARGVEVWLVSASPLLAVEVGSERVQVRATERIGIEWAGRRGFVAPWPIDSGKPAACRARGQRPPALALGDTRWDLPLLEWADLGFMLTPARSDSALHKTAAALLADG